MTMNKKPEPADVTAALDEGERAWKECLQALAEEMLEFETLSPEEVAELKKQGRI